MTGVAPPRLVIRPSVSLFTKVCANKHFAIAPHLQWQYMPSTMFERARSSEALEDDFDIVSALVDDHHAEAKSSPTQTPAVQDLAALDVDASDDAPIIADLQTSANRKVTIARTRANKNKRGFQAFGLNSHLLKAIARKGFTIPTPIQRKTIPLILDRQDVVGMARTGSGKTAAFVLPMIERLKVHNTKVGIRSLIMSPSRELALQTLKVCKEFGRGTDLRSVLLVGGDSLEEQFEAMASNPDIVIATPGRFVHLKVEMGLDLSSVQYVVFDEADRLFEMGFAAQLTEILHALPSSRQTTLFSATLPKSLVEFAKAGLQEPRLVRLDAESKISQDLQNAFFTIKSADKEGALLHILHDVIKMPLGETEATTQIKSSEHHKEQYQSKKRKREGTIAVTTNESPTKHSTMIFVATKHHVEYVATILRQNGFAVSHAYGSLDQTARKIQVQNFRTGNTSLLVVTDVAARGIDIPVLANVINYDFPAQPKIFVHRVGRTARAGQRGWSYSLVRESDAPYLLDLQLFLSKKLILGRAFDGTPNFADDVVVGAFAREKLEHHCEWASKLFEEDAEIAALRSVALRGEKLYLKTRNSASSESARRAKQITSSENWMGLNPLLIEGADDKAQKLEQMLVQVSSFKPQETIFEIGKRGTGGEAGEIMKKRRSAVDAARKKRSDRQLDVGDPKGIEPPSNESFVNHRALSEDKPGKAELRDSSEASDLDVDLSSASSDELEITFSNTGKKSRSAGFRDTSFFMSYEPSGHNLAEDRAYGVHSGASTNNSHFVTAARSATMDIVNDDGGQGLAEPSSKARMRWDKKSKKYVARANDEDGSKGVKYIRGEGGQKIAASFRSGRFDAWKRANKVKVLPRVGEAESSAAGRGPSQLGGVMRKWKHTKSEAPKEADKYRDDFHKRKKRVDEAKEARRGRYREGAGRNEIKSVDAVRKERKLKERRREKNGRGRNGARAGK